MEVIACNKEFNGKAFGYTIKHNQPKGWMGTSTPYIGWYRYKKDAIKRIKELQTFL